VEFLRSLALDLLVTAAFGQLLRPVILRLPRLGCVNIHASLLPKYRGAAPINWAIINGERETGVTAFLMDEGMDTGPILLQRRTEIGPDETAGELEERLSQLGRGASRGDRGKTLARGNSTQAPATQWTPCSQASQGGRKDQVGVGSPEDS
jgi:methionyl-tRNA formyltransferase